MPHQAAAVARIANHGAGVALAVFTIFENGGLVVSAHVARFELIEEASAHCVGAGHFVFLNELSLLFAGFPRSLVGIFITDLFDAAARAVEDYFAAIRIGFGAA